VASITRESSGRRLIQFAGQDGRRKSIRLGKVSQRVAEEIRVKVEHLIASAASNCPIDQETASWLARIGDDLADKLSAVGLTGRRTRACLDDFLADYIRRRTDIKPNTVRNLEAARSRLVEFFGPNKSLRDITPGDADAWLLALRENYANGTAGRTAKRAQQFFHSAVRQRLITENPFADLKAPSQVNESRKHFITLAEAQKVLEACPDGEWRLLFALSRFGGLRCPSEHLALKWSDVDWENDRLRVSSPKTEHHEGGAERWLPIFPELRPHLEEVFELAEPGTVHVITRYRDPNQNLRTQFLRIIRRAGLKPWPKLFHNLRASRETELAAEYPIHVVCSWIGNTAMIAVKHYLQVTDDYFERAAKSAANSDAPNVQNPVQQPAARSRTDRRDPPEGGGATDVALVGAGVCEVVQDARMPPIGLEPITR